MKKNDLEEADDLLPEYDLTTLKVRKFGPERQNFTQHGVILETDVATAFPDSSSVNQASRYFLRTTNRGFRMENARHGDAVRESEKS